MSTLLTSSDLRSMKASHFAAAATALTLTLLMSGCVSTNTKTSKIEHPAPVASGNDAVISMWSGPVKDRGARFDVSFNVKNMTNDQSIVVPSTEVSCKRGTAKGQLKSSGKTKIEAGVYLKPGQTRTFSLSCVLAERSGGDYTIEVGKIFAANPNGTPSQTIIAKDLSWHYVDAESAN